jgi:hypothetical protein
LFLGQDKQTTRRLGCNQRGFESPQFAVEKLFVNSLPIYLKRSLIGVLSTEFSLLMASINNGNMLRL